MWLEAQLLLFLLTGFKKYKELNVENQLNKSVVLANRTKKAPETPKLTWPAIIRIPFS